MQPTVITRRLTEDFILLRNNAMQNRHFYVDQSADDRVELMERPRKTDVELGPPIGSQEQYYLSADWLSSVDEIQFEISRIKTKLKELTAVHERHFTRPSFDETSREERTIDALTQELTRMLSAAQSHMQHLEQQMKSRRTSKASSQLCANVIAAFAKQLQELAFAFSRQQNLYLAELRKRDDRHKQFLYGASDNQFDLVRFSDPTPDSSELAVDDIPGHDANSQPLTRAQKQALLEQDIEELREREKQIERISQSIGELNSLFKDVAMLVVEQGTVLDRIDCNLEKAETSVEQGLRQLQKAEKHQQKNRKMLCVIGLAISIVVLLIILIIAKSF